MPLSCAHVHLCLTQVCATHLPRKCSLSGRMSTTKFSKKGEGARRRVPMLSAQH